jgi:peptidoglycan/LPS O-acetylase OafA/YrhL
MDGRKIPIGHSTRLGNNVPNKIQYLEGLRGIVATQVVLLHFVTAFLPDTAEHAAPPMRLLFDGHTAVYVFLISGAVLTPSFARDGAWIGQAAKRVVRIGIPVVLGALLNPMAQRLLSCGPSRQLGRLSFSIYLLHFPILFTLICVGFMPSSGALPYPAAVTVIFAGFMATTLLAADALERWVDRPAIRLGRRAGSASWPRL